MKTVSNDEIIAQVNRIVSSVPFTRSERLSAFLKYIVEEKLNNNVDKIKAYSIAVSVFDRPPTFDDQSDNIVRVYGGKLRRELEYYYSKDGKDDSVIISVPKGGYIPVISYRDSMLIDKQAGLLGKSDNRENPIAGNSKADSKGANPTIAIEMFKCLNKKDEYGYLASGLTLECILSLSQFPALTVLGPLTSTENIFNNESGHFDDSIFVLKGWISMEGEILKIQASLTMGFSQKHTWGKSFKFDLSSDSLLTIEQEVSSTIAGAIGDELGIIFHQIQSESYPEYIKFNDVTHAVLKANTYWYSQDPEEFRQAYLSIIKALENQPKNALLHALMGNLLYNDVLHQSNWLQDSRDRMEPQIRYAIALDPKLQIARYNMVVLNSFLGNANECSKEAQEVLAMNPNSTRILGGCSIATVTVGFYDQAKEYIERAKKLNPQFPSWYHLTDYIIAYKNQEYDLALELSKKIHVSGVLWHPIFRASILGKLGKKKEAAHYLKELLELKPDFLSQPLESIRSLFILDKHVEMIWDGLCKAGIKDIS